MNGAVTLTPTVCSHSIDVMDDLGNTGWHGKVMNQADHMRTMVLHCLAGFRKRDRIAPVKKQLNIRTRQFLGNRAANSAARTCDKVALHLYG